jgi:hypothetical protein
MSVGRGKAPARTLSLSFEIFGKTLEAGPKPKLHHARPTNRVGDLAEIRRGIANHDVWLCVVDRVEDIEDIPANLDVAFATKSKRLRYADIDFSSGTTTTT